MKKYDYILWDWNGTLLDDLQVCIKCINITLSSRNMPIMTKERYYKEFCFPVINYYKKMGFDFEKEDYKIVAKEFIDNYNKFVNECGLHKQASKVIGKFAACGIPQYILSASDKDVLLKSLDKTGLKAIFKDIIAEDNIYAKGKLELAKNYFASNKPTGKGLLIGDTSHDYEVANAVGLDCILFSKGHSQRESLELLGVPIVDELSSILEFVFDKDTIKDCNKEKESSETSAFVNNYMGFYDDIKPHKLDSKSDW
ncbi:MAG: HAD hydrolase-like protein [Clostridia bacterium]